MHAFTQGKRQPGLHRLLIFLTVLCALLAIAVPARAAATVDYTQKGSLTIAEGEGALSQKYSGIVVNLYKVAVFDTASPSVRFNLTGSFAGSGIEVNGLSVAAQQQDAAAKLTSFIQSRAIKSTSSVTTGTDGRALFQDLELGLYLVTASASPGSSKLVSSTPFLISLPYSDSGGWNYSVTAQPKCAVSTLPPYQPPTGDETSVIYALFGIAASPLILGILILLKRHLSSHRRQD